MVDQCIFGSVLSCDISCMGLFGSDIVLAKVDVLWHNQVGAVQLFATAAFAIVFDICRPAF